jgi:hypothetical protein
MTKSESETKGAQPEPAPEIHRIMDAVRARGSHETNGEILMYLRAIDALGAEPVSAPTDLRLKDQRAAFEAWFEPTYLDRPKWDEKRNCYTEICVHLAWRGFVTGWRNSTEIAARHFDSGDTMVYRSEVAAAIRALDGEPVSARPASEPTERERFELAWMGEGGDVPCPLGPEVEAAFKDVCWAMWLAAIKRPSFPVQAEAPKITGGWTSGTVQGSK